MARQAQMNRSRHQHLRRLAAVMVALVSTSSNGFADPNAGSGLQGLPLPSVPPQLSYGKICRKADKPAPLSTDWQSWNGKLPDLPAETISADAIRLIDGGAGVVRDLPLARRILEQLVADNAATGLGAKRRLALLLIDPRSGPVDRERAAKLLIEATSAQETDAALTLGRLIARGELPSLPLSDAARYLGIAAGFGEPMAAMELASLYAGGTLAEPFEGAAVHFANLATINVQTALGRGDCGLTAEIGQFLIDRGLPDADHLSVAWFEIAAKAGHRAGLEKLARAYQQGKGVAADSKAAQELWQDAIAAGSVTGYAASAELSLTAGADAKDIEPLLQAGIANADPSAVLFGARYYRGDFTGIADFDRMQAILQPAAQKPDTSIYTLDILAGSYLTGQGVAPDRARADELYQRIHAVKTPDAEALYGRYLLKWGGGLQEAETTLRKATDGGSALARATLVDVALCRPASDLDPDRWLVETAADGNALAIRKQARRALEAGDREKAADLFEAAVTRGDRVAMVEQAASLIAEAGGLTKASRALIAGAAAPGDGVVSGRLALAQAYRNGKLGPDEGESTALLATLKQSLDPAADLEIARLALDGDGPKADTVQRLERAATAGHPGAMMLLARLKAADPATAPQADAWLINAAERGNAEALAELGDDPTRLAQVAKALDATLLCDIDALVQKSRIHRLLGEEPRASETLNDAEAIVAHAPRQRLALAQAILSLSPSAADDARRAARLLEGAAARGNGKAALTLARLQESDRLGKERGAAIRWYREAALIGEQSAIPELARLAEGGTARDALDALKAVAETGNPSALRSVGMLLATRGDDSQSEGLRLLEEAAGKKDVAAMKILARFHAAGIDGHVSAAKSTDWTRLAAEQGDPEAMFQYAIALDLGFGVTSDPQSAKSWHEKALKNGYVE